MKYQVNIVKTSIKEVIQEADSEDEAYRIVRERYFNSEIILTEHDFCDVEFYSKVYEQDE